MNDYEKYQLQWMIDHRYSLKNLMNSLADAMNDELDAHGNAYRLIEEAFDIFEEERGFAGSEIWACEDEWKNLDKDEKGTFFIYQLKKDEKTRDLKFLGFDTLKEMQASVDRSNYDLVYSDVLQSGTELEDIYLRFNVEIPDGYKGHSLSVSDVIVLDRGGERHAYYVDSFGFKEIPEFEKEPRKEHIAGKEFRMSYRNLFQHLMKYELDSLGISCDECLLDDAYEKMMKSDEIVSLMNPDILKLVLEMKEEKKIENAEAKDILKENEKADEEADMQF